MSTCAEQGCVELATGKSQYCPAHKRERHIRWKAMIAAKAGEREQRDQGFAELHTRADLAGKQAALACTPQPMTVVQHTNPLDDASPVQQSWDVPDGVCGFAWVNVRPGNCPFANWLKKNCRTNKGYYGGIEMSVSDYGQSMERKQAYARAYAEVVREAGINIHAMSRID